MRDILPGILENGLPLTIVAVGAAYALFLLVFG